MIGFVFERPIEQRLGTRRTTAIGLVAGGLAMSVADRRGQILLSRNRTCSKARSDPRLLDALALGAAQACALVPGVSRHGAALTALRALGFSRPRAHALSREAAKPVLLGAAVLKAFRVREGFGPLAAAAAGSAIATAAARKALAGRGVRMPLWPFALYRAALAASVWRHGRR